MDFCVNMSVTNFGVFYNFLYHNKLSLFLCQKCVKHEGYFTEKRIWDLSLLYLTHAEIATKVIQKTNNFEQKTNFL